MTPFIDYTTVVNVKQALHIESASDDPLIARLVTAASRTIDEICTGSSSPAALGYFQQQTVVGEVARAQVDALGGILVYLKKHGIQSVSAFSWRTAPQRPWTPVTDLTTLEIRGAYGVYVYAGLASRSSNMRVQINYVGGLATTQGDLPASLVELATLLAGRFYREDESGLTDAIGIATVGSVQYTKALPERFQELIKVYQRVVPFE